MRLSACAPSGSDHRGGGGDRAGHRPTGLRSRPPNFDIVASGPVGFGCAEGAGLPNCTPPFSVISGTAPSSGTHIGGTRDVETREVATPIPTFTDNSIDGNAVVTATNGDKIFIHYSGTSPAPSPDNMGVGHLNDNLKFSITGGTGRFADAPGAGRLTATGAVYYDGRPTIVSSELAGTIDMHNHKSATRPLPCDGP